MAQRPYPDNSYYGSQPTAPPPPPYAGQPPPPPPYGMPPQPPVYYQPPPPQPQGYPTHKQPYGKVQTSHGLLGSVAKSISSVATEATTLYSRNVHGDVLSMMQSGRTVVLVSRLSGRSLQIVQTSDGRLGVDAGCVDAPHVFNNKWLIHRLPNNVFLFSNYNNFLAIQNGQLTVVMGVLDPRNAPATAHFKLSQSEHFVMLESAFYHGQYVAANERGEIKPPVATTGDKFSHFGVQF